MSSQIIEVDNLEFGGVPISESVQNEQLGLVQLANIVGEDVGGNQYFGKCSVGTNIIAVSAESYFRIYEYKNNEIQYTGFEVTAESDTKFNNIAVSGNDQFVAVVVNGATAPNCINIYSQSKSSWSLFVSLPLKDVFSGIFSRFTAINLDYNGNRFCVSAGGITSKTAVFKRIGLTFLKEVEIPLDSPLAFGTVKLSHDGDVVVIGNPTKTVMGVIGSGEAYVYTRLDTIWTLKATLRSATQSLHKWFGMVSLSDDGTQVVAGCAVTSSAYELLAFHSSDGWETNSRQSISVPNVGSGVFSNTPYMINNEIIVDISSSYMTYRNFGGVWEPSSSVPIKISNVIYRGAVINKNLVVVGDQEYSNNIGQFFVYGRSSKPQVIDADIDISSGYTIESGVDLVTVGTGGTSVDINLPLFPTDGDEVTIVFNTSATSVTIKGSTNLFDGKSESTVLASANYSDGDIIKFKFIYATGLWYKD